MKSGIMFEQGDILLVPFPFSDLSGVKQRPVLVLSKNSYNRSFEDIVVCGITSNLKSEPYSVFIDTSSLSSGNIPISSRIKVDKIFSIEKIIIIKKLARVKEIIFNNVRKEFLGIVS